MPTTRDVTVQLYPAKNEGPGMVSIDFCLTGDPPTKKFQASTTAEIIAIAKRFTEEHGKPCAPFIRIANGQRKPPGFDAAINAFRFCNLDEAPAVCEAPKVDAT